MLRAIPASVAATGALAFIASLGACSSDPAPPAPPAATDTDGGGPPATDRTKVGCEACTVFTGGLIFDGTTTSPGTLVVEGAKIQRVVHGEVEVTSGKQIDATGKTILPGLFDMHVHSSATSGPLSFYAQDDLVPSHFKASLRAGVTSYLDLGSRAHVIFEWRARLAAKKVFGPRLFAAGPMFTTTGGHPCYSGSPLDDACELVDTPSEAAAAFARLVPQKPDIVKVILEPGNEFQPLPRMPSPSIVAIQQAAQQAKLSVIAHVGTSKDVEDALAAGIRLFAHVPGSDRMTADLAQRLASANAIVVPTLAVFDNYYRTATRTLTELDDPAIRDDVPEEVVAALEDPQQLADMTDPSYITWLKGEQANGFANFKLCHEAGVRIAAGTDAGNPGTFHGRSLRRELALYVQQGMKPVDALVAATKNAADLLGRSDLGRIEPGAVADLLVVTGDPSTDIQVLAEVDSVYVDGVAIDRAALALTKNTSLVREPAKDQADGAACLGPNECTKSLTCNFDKYCAPLCSSSASCNGDAKCINIGFGDPYCSTDKCDPVAQDCRNGAACIWLGDGATLCTFADDTRPAGTACGPFQSCARGSECDLSGKCRQICKPGVAGACPVGETCVDRSNEAGLSVGECL